MKLTETKESVEGRKIARFVGETIEKTYEIVFTAHEKKILNNAHKILSQVGKLWEKYHPDEDIDDNIYEIARIELGVVLNENSYPG